MQDPHFRNLQVIVKEIHVVLGHPCKPQRRNTYLSKHNKEKLRTCVTVARIDVLIFSFVVSCSLVAAAMA
jgi:hypothetical protein